MGGFSSDNAAHVVQRRVVEGPVLAVRRVAEPRYSGLRGELAQGIGGPFVRLRHRTNQVADDIGEHLSAEGLGRLLRRELPGHPR